MEIASIKTQRDYRRALKEIEALMRARRNTPEGNRLDVLVTLVEAWERKRYQGYGVAALTIAADRERSAAFPIIANPGNSASHDAAAIHREMEARRAH